MAKFDCGCRTSPTGETIIYCPKHAAAPELYEALRGIKELAKGYAEMPKDLILQSIDKVLAKAEGK